MTISGKFERFRYFNSKTNFLEIENLFQKTGVSFLVESTKIGNASFPYKPPCQKPMLRQIEWWIQSWSITKRWHVCFGNIARCLSITSQMNWNAQKTSPVKKHSWIDTSEVMRRKRENKNVCITHSVLLSRLRKPHLWNLATYLFQTKVRGHLTREKSGGKFPRKRLTYSVICWLMLTCKR